MTVRETAFEVGLKAEGSAGNVPGAVVNLSVEKEPQAALVSRIGRGHAACLTQGCQRLSGGERVA